MSNSIRRAATRLLALFVIVGLTPTAALADIAPHRPARRLPPPTDTSKTMAEALQALTRAEIHLRLAGASEEITLVKFARERLADALKTEATDAVGERLPEEKARAAAKARGVATLTSAVALLGANPDADPAREQARQAALRAGRRAIHRLSE